MRTISARSTTLANIQPVSLSGWLNAVLAAGSAAYVLAFVVAALFRLSYPFPLEVTEGLALRQVQDILEGQPIYVAPTLQHVPLIYGPVLFYAAALVAKVVGLSYVPLRLISLLASVGTLALVALLVYRETENRTASIASMGLLAATYPLAQTVMDLGRVDALFVFFLAAAMYVGYTESQRARVRWPVLAGSGALVALAGLTKIPTGAVPIALTLGAYLVLVTRTRAIGFIVGFVLTMLAALLVLRAQTGPWATWYMLDLASMHAVQQNLLDRFWFSDILPRLTLPLLIGPAYLIGETSRRNQRPLLFYGLSAVGLLALGWASRSSSGGSTNVLLPAEVALALFFGLGLAAIMRYLRSAGGLREYALGVCLVQLALLAYNPRLTVPLRSDQWADERLAQGLAALPGEIFAPNLDPYLRSSDKGEQPLTGAAEEITAGYGGTPTPEGVAWRAALEGSLKERRFRYVVLDEGSCCLTQVVLANGYVDAGPLFGPDDDFWRWKSKHTPEEHLYAPPWSGG